LSVQLQPIKPHPAGNIVNITTVAQCPPLAGIHRDTRMKTATPLVNCFVNDALVHVMPNVQQTLLPFVDIVYSQLIVCYLQTIFIINGK